MSHNHIDVGMTHLAQPTRSPVSGPVDKSHTRINLITDGISGRHAETNAGVTQFGAFEAVRVTIDRAARALHHRLDSVNR
jgi:hypothetical protein